MTPPPTGKVKARLLSDRMKDAHVRAMQYLQEWFVARCEEEFNQADWKFNTEPKVRDIVDTGRLRDSVVVRRFPDGTFEVTWATDYAFDVHEGGTNLDGTKFPGRPWTRDPIAELPQKYSEFFTNALHQS